MKKNYLKPLCMATPMRGLRLMEGSVRLNHNVEAASQFSRETNDVSDGGGIPSQNSVWDD